MKANKIYGTSRPGGDSLLIKKIPRIIIILIIFVTYPCRGEFNSESHLIDIPTAYLGLATFSAGINMSFTTSKDPYPQDYNSYLRLQVFDRVQLGLSIYTAKLQVLDIEGIVLTEGPYLPAIGIGSTYLTKHEFASPVSIGPGIGWKDDQTYEQRNSERFSWFTVLTKDFGPYGIYTLGIGRGDFVGYGSRSYMFNSDLYSDTKNNNAIGIFWGGEVLLSEPVFGVMDFDGRDFNVGIKLKSEFWQMGFAVAKLEHRLKGAPNLYPRFACGGSVNSLLTRHILRPDMGTLTVTVNNAGTGAPVYAVVSFPGKTIAALHTSRETGSCTIYLQPGTYWVRVGALGSLWTERRVYVDKGTTTVAYFNIRPLVSF
ncbi:MAG: hypothetical protein PHE49_00545 [bacterium]|nr:hypothetical protein [bacterium]